MYQPFSDEPDNRGLLSDEMHPPTAMRARLMKADAAGLQLRVHAIGDHGIANHDGGDLGRKLHELCLIDIDGDTVGIGRGQADRRPQQDSCNEGTQSEPRACANTLNLERHTLPRGINKPAKAIRSGAGARHGKSDVN